MDNVERAFFGMIGILFLLMLQVAFTVQTSIVTKYHDIYQATLPFGIIQLSGDAQGTFFFGTGEFSSSITSEEFYFIKYFDGKELKSLSLEADKTPIIIDETFRLEETTHQKYFYIFFWKINFSQPYVWNRKVHIPYLPEVNQTLTEKWEIS